MNSPFFSPNFQNSCRRTRASSCWSPPSQQASGAASFFLSPTKQAFDASVLELGHTKEILAKYDSLSSVKLEVTMVKLDEDIETENERVEQMETFIHENKTELSDRLLQVETLKQIWSSMKRILRRRTALIASNTSS
jgi:hypothetical protein